MEVPAVQPKREWPKFLWGPDGRQARFDSPADVPRDYFPTPAEAKAYAERPKPATQHLTEPAALAASVAEMEEFRKWQAQKAAKVTQMAKARAARKPKAEPQE